MRARTPKTTTPGGEDRRRRKAAEPTRTVRGGRSAVSVRPARPIDGFDPGWLFLMLASKGMVVERGSMLSHTAITGRKFGIPTIVALPNATRAIPDGALIEIDGCSGVVTILEHSKGAAA